MNIIVGKGSVVYNVGVLAWKVSGGNSSVEVFQVYKQGMS